MSHTSRKNRAKSPLTARSGANGPSREEILASALPACKTCRRRYSPHQDSQVYCSPRCRLLAWAARQLVRLHAEGRVPGLEETIAELKESKS